MSVAGKFSPLFTVLRSGSTQHELTSLTVTHVEGPDEKEEAEEGSGEENEGRTERSNSSSSSSSGRGE